jgi:hypothetical protein
MQSLQDVRASIIDGSGLFVGCLLLLTDVDSADHKSCAILKMATSIVGGDVRILRTLTLEASSNAVSQPSFNGSASLSSTCVVSMCIEVVAKPKMAFVVHVLVCW